MAKLRITAITICFLSALPATGIAANTANCGASLLQIGFDGKVEGGSRQAVLQAGARGDALRVGWDIDFDGDSTADLTHWSDARFLSIWQGEVFAQVESIHRQHPVRADRNVVLSSESAIWHGLIGTDGLLRGKIENSDQSGERRVRSVWCQAAPVWSIAFRNDTDGSTLQGSRAALFRAVRAGEPVRLGWGLSRTIDGVARTIEHVSEPVFLSIIDGREVVAQLPEHIAQRSYWNAEQAGFADGAVMWRGVVSSTGAFDAIWVNRATGETVRRQPQRAAISWYLRSPHTLVEHNLARELGVIADKAAVEPAPASP